MMVIDPGVTSRQTLSQHGQPRTSADQVSGLVTQIHELVEAVSQCVCGAAHGSTDEFVDDDEVVHGVVLGLLDESEREALWVLPGVGASQRRLDLSLQELGHARRRGINVKALVPAISPIACRRVDEPETRVAQVPVSDVLVLDGRVALIRPQSTDSGGRAAVLREPGTTRVLHHLILDAWRSAVSFEQAVRFRERVHRPTTRLILSSLWQGDIDEVAARKIGISVRTYRRYVADIMHDLSAKSRFQAGVRAAELHLLASAVPDLPAPRSPVAPSRC